MAGADFRRRCDGVANSCPLGVEDARLHSLYTTSLMCIVALVLVAIAEINRPFQGIIRVGSESFELALATFDQHDNR